MNYNGHNYAVKHLQLELFLYYFTICHRPGRMMEDANYLSNLNQDISIDVIRCDYLSFAIQIYSQNTPPSAEINAENMPGMKPKRITSSDQTTINNDINFANLKLSPSSYHEIKEPDTGKDLLALTIQNVPIQYLSKKLGLPSSSQ
jgi:hypothetical protein